MQQIVRKKREIERGRKVGSNKKDIIGKKRKKNIPFTRQYLFHTLIGSLQQIKNKNICSLMLPVFKPCLKFFCIKTIHSNTIFILFLNFQNNKKGTETMSNGPNRQKQYQINPINYLIDKVI